MESDDLDLLKQELEVCDLTDCKHSCNTSQVGEMYLARARELHALSLSSRTAVVDVGDDGSASPVAVAWNEAVQSRKRVQAQLTRSAGAIDPLHHTVVWLLRLLAAIVHF